jgi:hypothetical protein
MAQGQETGGIVKATRETQTHFTECEIADLEIYCASGEIEYEK